MDNIIYNHIDIRYGELSTKGKNRKDFINKLNDNLHKRLKDFTNLKYHILHDNILIDLNGEDYEEIKKCLNHIFGIANFRASIKTSLDMEEIKEKALMIVNNGQYKTFKIITKRSNKNYYLRSDDINRMIAGHILKNSNLSVDVHNPDLQIYIHIKNNEAYLTDKKIKGLGGYPVGINGKALLMMSGGIDSPVAGFLSQKRGLKIEAIHFASPPYTSKKARDKVLSLARSLSHYQEEVIVHIIPFTDIQLAIYQKTNESYAITLMRRMMYRIADKIAKENNIKVITNGESVGQVASQTIESMSIISKVSDTLILRPLCMFDKLEIIDIAKKINTYETSILPYQDCCTIFDPKNPITKPKEEKCLEYESLFDYDKLINESINNKETIKVSYKQKEVIEDESIF